MSMHSSISRASQPIGGKTMKTIASLALGAIALAVAGAASAQETIDMTGTAEAECHLPTSWQYISNNNLPGGNFTSGTNTWNIPSSLLTDANGQSNGSGQSDVAIRIRGTSFCNTAHTIVLTSQNGGLVAAAAPVAGFANRRTMKYDAYWSDGGNAFGGAGRSVQNFLPTSPGQSATATYTIATGAPPPGNRTFDIRMGLQRNAPNIPAQPMLSGAYQDVLTVTLTPIS